MIPTPASTPAPPAPIAPRPASSPDTAGDARIPDFDAVFAQLAPNPPLSSADAPPPVPDRTASAESSSPSGDDLPEEPLPSVPHWADPMLPLAESVTKNAENAENLTNLALVHARPALPQQGGAPAARSAATTEAQVEPARSFATSPLPVAAASRPGTPLPSTDSARQPGAERAIARQGEPATLPPDPPQTGPATATPLLRPTASARPASPALTADRSAPAPQTQTSVARQTEGQFAIPEASVAHAGVGAKSAPVATFAPARPDQPPMAFPQMGANPLSQDEARPEHDAKGSVLPRIIPDRTAQVTDGARRPLDGLGTTTPRWSPDRTVRPGAPLPAGGTGPQPGLAADRAAARSIDPAPSRRTDPFIRPDPALPKPRRMAESTPPQLEGSATSARPGLLPGATGSAATTQPLPVAGLTVSVTPLSAAEPIPTAQPSAPPADLDPVGKTAAHPGLPAPTLPAPPANAASIAARPMTDPPIAPQQAPPRQPGDGAKDRPTLANPPSAHVRSTELPGGDPEPPPQDATASLIRRKPSTLPTAAQVPAPHRFAPPSQDKVMPVAAQATEPPPARPDIGAAAAASTGSGAIAPRARTAPLPRPNPGDQPTAQAPVPYRQVPLSQDRAAPMAVNATNPPPSRPDIGAALPQAVTTPPSRPEPQDQSPPQVPPPHRYSPPSPDRVALIAASASVPPLARPDIGRTDATAPHGAALTPQEGAAPASAAATHPLPLRPTEGAATTAPIRTAQDLQPRGISAGVPQDPPPAIPPTHPSDADLRANPAPPVAHAAPAQGRGADPSLMPAEQVPALQKIVSDKAEIAPSAARSGNLIDPARRRPQLADQPPPPSQAITRPARATTARDLTPSPPSDPAPVAVAGLTPAPAVAATPAAIPAPAPFAGPLSPPSGPSEAATPSGPARPTDASAVPTPAPMSDGPIAGIRQQDAPFALLPVAGPPQPVDPWSLSEAPNQRTYLTRQESLFPPQTSLLSPDDRPVSADPRPTAMPDLITHQILPRIGAPGAVSVTLAPAELGSLQFEVTLQGDMLHLHLVVEQPATLDLLRRQGDQMLAELRQAGFAQASLSFASHDGQSGQNARNGDPQAAPQAPATPLSGPIRAVDPAPRPTTPTGSLDLRL